jgi:hypothetical protein
MYDQSNAIIQGQSYSVIYIYIYTYVPRKCEPL